VDPAEWRRVLATDLDGAFWTARAAVPHVVARRGVLLFISSIGADLAGAGGAPYHVAKAGVNALMKVLAKEVAPAGVRVNGIAPGAGRASYLDALVRGSSPCARGRRARRAARPVSAGRPAHAGC